MIIRGILGRNFKWFVVYFRVYRCTRRLFYAHFLLLAKALLPISCLLDNIIFCCFVNNYLLHINNILKVWFFVYSFPIGIKSFVSCAFKKRGFRGLIILKFLFCGNLATFQAKMNINK